MSRPKNTRSAAEHAARVTRWLEIATLVGVYGGLLMPLVFARIVIYPYVYLKMLYFQLLIGLTFPAWVALSVRDPRYRFRASWLLWAILGWFAAMALSSVLAASTWRSVFGTQDRMTGFFSLLHFFAWSLMAASVLQTPRDWRRLLDAQLGVGFVAACAVLLQLAFPNLIGTREIQEGERLSGLLGNPIFSGAYQTFSIYLVLYLWKSAIPKMRVWYVLVTGTAVAAIVAAGSRGPMLGLMVGLTTTVLITAFVTRHRRIVLYLCAASTLVLAGYLSVVFFALHRPSLEEFWRVHWNLKHLFEVEIEGARAQLWRIAWDAFLKRPILGWGPAGFETAFDVVYRPENHVLGIQDEAHNRVLGVMCETGLIGLLAYLGMWAAYFAVCATALRHHSLQPLEGAALIGAAAGHFVQCLFAFDTPATLLTTYLLFALASRAAVAHLPAAAEREGSGWVATYQKWVPLGSVPALVYAAVLLGTVLPGAVSIYARSASTALSEGKPDQMLSLLARARRLSTPYHDDQLLVLSRGILRLAKAKKFEDWSGRKQSLLLVQSIADKYFSRQKHPRLRRVYASMLFVIGATHNSPRLVERAGELYRQNVEESPRRQRYLIDYAKYLSDTGNPSEAEALFLRAVNEDPVTGEPRWEYGKFLWIAQKRSNEGARWMADAFDGPRKFMPTNSLECQQLAQALQKTGKTEKLREVVGLTRGFPPDDRPLKAYLAIGRYMEKAGLLAERDQVLRIARELNRDGRSVIDAVLSGKITLQALHEKQESKAKTLARVEVGAQDAARESPTSE